MIYYLYYNGKGVLRKHSILKYCGEPKKVYGAIGITNLAPDCI